MRAYHPLLASLLVACFLGSSRADGPLWNLWFGDANLQAARDLAVDSWGNTVVAAASEP